MIRLEDIRSLTEFQRNSREHIRRLKRTGRPEILTVNGQAEVVVQDAKSYQRLLARIDEAEQQGRLRHAISDYRAGRVRDLDEVMDEIEADPLGKAAGAAPSRKPRRRQK